MKVKNGWSKTDAGKHAAESQKFAPNWPSAKLGEGMGGEKETASICKRKPCKTEGLPVIQQMGYESQQTH